MKPSRDCNASREVFRASVRVSDDRVHDVGLHVFGSGGFAHKFRASDPLRSRLSRRARCPPHEYPITGRAQCKNTKELFA